MRRVMAAVIAGRGVVVTMVVAERRKDEAARELVRGSMIREGMEMEMISELRGIGVSCAFYIVSSCGERVVDRNWIRVVCYRTGRVELSGVMFLILPNQDGAFLS